MGWQQRKGCRTGRAEHLQGRDHAQDPSAQEVGLRHHQTASSTLTCSKDKHSTSSPFSAVRCLSGNAGTLHEAGATHSAPLQSGAPIRCQESCWKGGPSATPHSEKMGQEVRPRKVAGGRRWAGQEVSPQGPEMEMETEGPGEVGGTKRGGDST